MLISIYQIYHITGWKESCQGGAELEKKICLNGLWDFSAKSDKVSVLPDAWEEEQIKVPSPYNINSFAGPREKNIRGDAYRVYGGDFRLYPEYPEGWESLTCGFYRRKVFVPLESVGKRLFLRFDGLSYHSAVYVNGRLAVEDMEGFLPVETEITSLVRFGEANEITVGAEKAKNLIYKDDAGRNRLDYPIGSFWGEHIGGNRRSERRFRRRHAGIYDECIVLLCVGMDL